MGLFSVHGISLSSKESSSFLYFSTSPLAAGQFGAKQVAS